MILFILALVLFLLFEFVMFFIRKVVQGNRVRRERAAALAESLARRDRLATSSLVRTDAPRTRARLLCISPDAELLTRIRSWLVLDGCAVDTIDKPAELLLVLGEYHYDFIIMDESLPDMHVTELIAQTRRARPDIDILLMTEVSEAPWAKQGVMHTMPRSVQEQELLGLVQTAIAERTERISVRLSSTVTVAEPSDHHATEGEGFAIPGGVFISPQHCWLSLRQDGAVLVGMDDFARKLIGSIDAIEMPNVGMSIVAGQVLFRVRQGYRSLPFSSPVSGVITNRNAALAAEPSALEESPYGSHWICAIDASDFDDRVPLMRIGHSAVRLFEADLQRVHRNLAGTSAVSTEGLRIGALSSLDDTQYERMGQELFMTPGATQLTPATS